MYSEADVDIICDAAANILGEPCHPSLDPDTKTFKAFSGKHHTVFPLQGSQSKSNYCIRMPKEPTQGSPDLLLQQEAVIRQRISAAGVGLVQPLIASNATTDNPLRTPFLALGWAEGKPLIWSDTVPSSEEARHNVLDAVANASIDLLSVNSVSNSSGKISPGHSERHC